MGRLKYAAIIAAGSALIWFLVVPVVGSVGIETGAGELLRDDEPHLARDGSVLSFVEIVSRDGIFHGLTLYDGSKVREKAAPYNSE